MSLFRLRDLDLIGRSWVCMCLYKSQTGAEGRHKSFLCQLPPWFPVLEMKMFPDDGTRAQGLKVTAIHPQGTMNMKLHFSIHPIVAEIF